MIYFLFLRKREGWFSYVDFFFPSCLLLEKGEDTGTTNNVIDNNDMWKSARNVIKIKEETALIGGKKILPWGRWQKNYSILKKNWLRNKMKLMKNKKNVIKSSKCNMNQSFLKIVLGGRAAWQVWEENRQTREYIKDKMLKLHRKGLAANCVTESIKEILPHLCLPSGPTRTY